MLNSHRDAENTEEERRKTMGEYIDPKYDSIWLMKKRELRKKKEIIREKIKLLDSRTDSRGCTPDLSILENGILGVLSLLGEVLDLID